MSFKGSFSSFINNCVSKIILSYKICFISGCAIQILDDGESFLIEIANSLPYGLAAYLYSDDLESAWCIADQLEFGAVGINVNDTSELQAPFGGWKMSGFGRELGTEGLYTYLETKHLKVRVNKKIDI